MSSSSSQLAKVAFRRAFLLRSLAAAVLGIAAALIVQSAWLKAATGNPFVLRPVGFDHGPYLLLVGALAAWPWWAGEPSEKYPYLTWPSRRQFLLAALVFVAAGGFAFWVTHPSQLVALQYTQAALRFPIVGQPLLGASVQAVLLLPALPALFLVFPWSRLQPHTLGIVGATVAFAAYLYSDVGLVIYRQLHGQ